MTSCRYLLHGRCALWDLVGRSAWHTNIDRLKYIHHGGISSAVPPSLQHGFSISLCNNLGPRLAGSGGALKVVQVLRLYGTWLNDQKVVWQTIVSYYRWGPLEICPSEASLCASLAPKNTNSGQDLWNNFRGEHFWALQAEACWIQQHPTWQA